MNTHLSRFHNYMHDTLSWDGRGWDLCFIILKKGERNIHTDDRVVVVASDMEPGAWIDKSRVPAHQHIVWVLPCLPLLVQYVTLEPKQHACFRKRLNSVTMPAMWYICSLPSVLQLASVARARRQLRTAVDAANWDAIAQFEPENFLAHRNVESGFA